MAAHGRGTGPEDGRPGRDGPDPGDDDGGEGSEFVDDPGAGEAGAGVSEADAAGWRAAHREEDGPGA